MKKVKKHLRILTTEQLVTLAVVRGGVTVSRARSLDRDALVNLLAGIDGVLRPERG